MSAEKFFVLRCGPMCGECAQRLKRAFECGEIASFESGIAVGESLHVGCSVGRFDVKIEDAPGKWGAS
jgi:hypothetical protein